MDSARLHTHIYLHPANPAQPWRIEAYALQNIGIITPSERVNCDVNKMEGNLMLADPEFSIPREIDIVLGANIYGQLVLSGVLSQAGLLAQSTIFGWVLTGSLPTTASHPTKTISACSTLSDENDLCHERLVGLVQRFWSMEDVPNVVRQSTADTECERIYATRHRRDSSGRYIVPLPTKIDKLPQLGESYSHTRAALTCAPFLHWN